MRKFLFIALFLVLFSGLVISAQNGTNGDYNQAGKSNSTVNANDSGNGIGQELNQQVAQIRNEFRNGNYTGPLGQFLNVSELAGNLRELRSNNYSVKTHLNLSFQNTGEEQKVRVMARLENGQEREIKIMPDTAAERALERLRIRVCSLDNNCTIQLKDVGNGTEERIQYELQIERHARILGIFQSKMQVKANVDAETGELRINKPWWAFLAAEPEE
jgi:hypothetical protein